MEKRYKKSASSEMAFSEHFALGDLNKVEETAEFEELLDYLRKKAEQRRLKAIDQVDDNKIAELIKDQPIPEISRAEGELEK